MGSYTVSQDFVLTQLVLIISAIGGMFFVCFGIFQETYQKKNRYHMIYFGVLFALIGIVGHAALIAGQQEGYRHGQVDAFKGNWKYTIVLEPKFEIKERIIEK